MSLTSLLIAALYGGAPVNGTIKPVPKKKRPCMNCGKMHNHNNAFCSADCCREYRK